MSVKRKIYNVVDASITKFLKSLTINEIDFDRIEEVIHKQTDKVFVFCDNGRLSSQRMGVFRADRTRFGTTKNTLIIYGKEDGLCLKFLLRWKNYKGVVGPAWQIILRKLI